jgi:hypothetical protein
MGAIRNRSDTREPRGGEEHPWQLWVTAIDALGQEGQLSSPVLHQHRYDGFFKGEWHQ